MDGPGLGPDARFATRRLAPPDLPALQTLFERASDYFEIATGTTPAPDEAERAFVGGPPSKAVSEKQTIGIFDTAGALVGLLDAIPDFPSEGTWTVGMLLLDPEARGRGLGGALLAAFEEWATRRGARRLRTALVAHHAPGIRFLRRAGYAEVSRLEGYAAGATPATVAFFEKDIRPAPV
jgi:GNAT superfamily N-acetyltransferase